MATEKHEETNVCEIIAVVLQRIRELEAECAVTSEQEIDREGLQSRIYELRDLCDGFGWSKYLPREA